MKGYTISQVAERFGLEPHTLRFYEKEGIISPGRTPSGIRTYSEEDIGQLETALCLKSTGMPLKEIKRYFQLVAEGDSTLDQRLEIFLEHRERVIGEMATMEKYLQKIDHKIEWYSGFLAEKKGENTEKYE